MASGLVAVAASSATAQTRRDAAACAALTNLQIPGITLSITKAEWFAEGSSPPAGRGGAPNPMKLPAYCRVDGVLDRRTGADGKPYGIGFALALPGDWNGRFLFQGGGGLNGSVQLPLGAVAAGTTPALLRGFAVVSTDTGHQGQGAFDASFMQEQQASLDFAYQAVGRIAVLAKQIIAQHYAKAPDRSYFTGCSTGGREAMLMAQRHPTFFDGIISGAPAMRTAYSGIGDEWVATMLNTAAPKDASGKVDPRTVLSDAQKKGVIDGVLNACDASDGLKDDMIFNTKACRFDPKTLVCGAKQDRLVPDDGAGHGDRKRVCRTEGLEGPSGLSGLHVRHRHRGDAGHPRTAARRTESRGPAVLRNHAWTLTLAPRPPRPVPRTC